MSTLRPLLEPIVRRALTNCGTRLFSAGVSIFDPLRDAKGENDPEITDALLSMAADGLLLASATIRCPHGHDIRGGCRPDEARVWAFTDRCGECDVMDLDDPDRDSNFVMLHFVATEKLDAAVAPPPGVVTVGMLRTVLGGIPLGVDILTVPALWDLIRRAMP